MECCHAIFIIQPNKFPGKHSVMSFSGMYRKHITLNDLLFYVTERPHRFIVLIVIKYINNYYFDIFNHN